MLVARSSIVAVGNTVPGTGLTIEKGHNWTTHFACDVTPVDAVFWLWIVVMATVSVLLAA